jgi:hypothetical protein
MNIMNKLMIGSTEGAFVAAAAAETCAANATMSGDHATPELQTADTVGTSRGRLQRPKSRWVASVSG